VSREPSEQPTPSSARRSPFRASVRVGSHAREGTHLFCVLFSNPRGRTTISGINIAAADYSRALRSKLPPLLLPPLRPCN